MSELKTIEELAPLLRVAPVTIRRLIHRGDLPFVQVGKKFLFTEEHVQIYLTRKSGNLLPNETPCP